MPNAPVMLSHLLKRQRTVTFKYGEDDQEQFDITLTFNPKKYTAKAHRMLVNMADEKGFDGMVSLLSDMLVEWNIAGEDGKKLPISVESLESLPVDLMLKIGNEIMSGINDQNPNSAPSPAG